jgi:hypothetical protein
MNENCWLWAGSVNNDDYGLAGGQYAHRLFYEIYKGKIAKGLQIDHLCFVPRCINPNHLEAVTELENIRRSWANRKSATHCPQDHLYSGSNLYLDGTSGARRCKECKKEQNRRSYIKRKLKRDLSKS